MKFRVLLSTKSIDMEESAAMTIEFLRARLLAERSVSRTSRQRADELSKRVVELEDQLKFITLQRKKAEKATSDVLAILENHGIRSDVSEAFDSSSDQEMTPCGSEAGNNSLMKEDDETSVSSKQRKNDEEELEELSPLSGRSLAWKSNKHDTPRPRDKSKYMDSSKRRNSSFSLIASSSPKHHLGKSCRRIRGKETRPAMDELKIETQSSVVDSSSEGLRNSESGTTDLTREESSEIFEEKVTTPSQSLNEDNNENKFMEKALEHQAQLIGRYEHEENAQREWEEKFKENNNCTQDLYEAGNQSDMTEERDETKSPTPAATSPITHDESQTENSTANKSNNLLPLEGPKTSTSHYNAIMPTHKPPVADLGSVLEALQQAKSSLQQKLHQFPSSESGTSIPPSSPPHVFVNCAELFRVPPSPITPPAPKTNFLDSRTQLSLPNNNYPIRSNVLNNDHQYTPSPYEETRLNKISRKDRFVDPAPSVTTYPTFPSFPNLTPRMLSNEEFSFYDNRNRN